MPMFSSDLSTNHIQGPTGPSRALRFLRLSIFSSNQGPVWALKTRALHEDKSQMDQHLVTDNVPALSISSHNVPTLIMFGLLDLPAGGPITKNQEKRKTTDTTRCLSQNIRKAG